MIPILADGGYALLQPFGLYLRQLPVPIPALKKGQTTSEPEITTGDGNDPDKIDSVVHIPDIISACFMLY